MADETRRSDDGIVRRGATRDAGRFTLAAIAQSSRNGDSRRRRWPTSLTQRRECRGRRSTSTSGTRGTSFRLGLRGPLRRSRRPWRCEALGDRRDECADALDGYLQRFEGDLWEQMAASAHSEEIMSAKSADTAAEIQHVVALGCASGLAAFLATACPWPEPDGSDSLGERSGPRCSSCRPRGSSSTRLPVAVYRRRLTTLARGVAADIDA